MKIGSKLRAAREALGLSQVEISSQIPMNQSSYSKIERDMQEPNLEQFRKICILLCVDPRYLLSLGEYDGISEEDVRFLSELQALYRKYYN